MPSNKCKICGRAMSKGFSGKLVYIDGKFICPICQKKMIEPEIKEPEVETHIVENKLIEVPKVKAAISEMHKEDVEAEENAAYTF